MPDEEPRLYYSCGCGAHRLLHLLWTKAVGKPDYVKAEWRALEVLLNRREGKGE